MRHILIVALILSVVACTEVRGSGSTSPIETESAGQGSTITL